MRIVNVRIERIAKSVMTARCDMTARSVRKDLSAMTARIVITARCVMAAISVRKFRSAMTARR